jgi:crotonobetainyl-CoA:carnitine CoA-transferase CaiB-like acyl-CoA transferase
MAGICEGLAVIEAGAGSVAASMTGMVLADAGARVIKLEPPEGDWLRRGNPSGFLVWNRGKESWVADLRTEPGREQLRALARHADVVITGFAPETLVRFGVDAETLRADNPALVHCCITGFGRTGGYAKLKAYDSIVAAKAGLWSRGSFSHREGATLAPGFWASFGAAMQSVAGILGALRVRDLAGRGQAIDTTLFAGLDPIDYFVATIAQLMAKRGEAPKADSRAATAASRFGVLVATRDGRFIQTSTVLPHQGRALCEVAGIADVLDEERFVRAPSFANPEDAQAWEDLLVAAFRERDLADWLPRLEANPDIAFEVAVTCEQGLDHPQIVHNGDVITLADETHGPVRQVGPIGYFSRTPIAPARSAPKLDRHGAAPRRVLPAGGKATAPDHPFAGIRIVEFGYFYAMPYALAMAAALGARVIKIEDGKGDPHRVSFGPEVATNKTTAGKESISLDLRSERGREIARQIVTRSDVFVTGFRSGIAEKLGLGHAELCRLNPRLLYVHAAGYGSDGPYAQRALYAQAAQAVAGSFGRQVGTWAEPSRNLEMSPMELQAVVLPRLGQIVDGDSNSALGLLAALALGIFHQQRTGEGQLLRTSMIGSNAWAYSDDFCAYDGKPPASQCDDEYYGTSALERVYQTAEGGWVCLAVRSDAEFRAALSTLGLPELAGDPRFANAAARAENDARLISEISAAFAKRSASEWEFSLTAAGVGCASVTMEGLGAFTSFDPILLESGLTVRFEHPLFGQMVRAAPPVSFSETPGRIAPPCARGEHNGTILAELGYGEEAIAGLEADRIVIPPAAGS